MDRRTLLKAAAAAAPLATSQVRLMAASTGTPRLLIVFLRGAYDAASLLVPLASSFYYEQRPTIAIARPGSPGDAAIPLDAEWGLNPALIDSMLPLFEKKQLAFVPFAGTDDSSRSHFETQDSIELGQPPGAARNDRSGFLNRLAEVLGARDAIAFTDRLPLVFRGPVQVPNLVLANLSRNAGRDGFDSRQSALIAGMYQGTPLESSVKEGFAVRDEALLSLNRTSPGGGTMVGEMVAANRNAVTARGFEGEARRIARLMRERYHLGFVDIGGWDTHVGQGAGSGYLANRLAELGKGLAAYADDMGSAWQDTTVVVVSEFGRTFRENGNRGTDHGHGSVYWVLGGGVRGGQVIGEQVAVGPASLFQNRDYPVLNEYRSWMGGLFARLYGLRPAQVQRVFAGCDMRDLRLA